MVYVCRNPKDCLVSFYKFHQSIVTPEMGGAPFEDFLKLAMDGEVEYGSYWEHLKSGWARSGHPNFKFVWFEDLKKETAKTIRDVPYMTSTSKKFAFLPPFILAWRS